MYEVWATQGQGGCKVQEKVTLQEALDYVEEHIGEASFAIKKPDGEWYKW
jgi:hypothetical protein